MRVVDLETAKAAPGLRLVLVSGVPSPWSQAAKALVDIEGVDAACVWRKPIDPDVDAWTGQLNAPVAMLDGEPPYTGWAEILGLVERLAPSPSLVPDDLESRVRMHGLSHELMGHDGLMWNMRLLMTDLSLGGDDPRGYPLPIAQYLAARYGHRPGCVGAARARFAEIAGALADQLRRHTAEGPYYFGKQLTALDVYSAACMDGVSPLPEAQCPMHPRSRGVFQATWETLRDEVPAVLIAHRDMMHERHMPLPMLLG